MDRIEEMEKLNKEFLKISEKARNIARIINEIVVSKPNDPHATLPEIIEKSGSEASLTRAYVRTLADNGILYRAYTIDRERQRLLFGCPKTVEDYKYAVRSEYKELLNQ